MSGQPCLEPGATVRYDGHSRSIVALIPKQSGGLTLRLRTPRGAECLVSALDLVSAPDFRVLTGEDDLLGPPQRRALFLESLPPAVADEAIQREEAVLRVEAAGGSMDEQAEQEGRALGVDRATVWRWVARHRSQGVRGLVDLKKVRRRNPLQDVPAEVLPILAEKARGWRRESDLTVETKVLRFRAALLDAFGEDENGRPRLSLGEDTRLREIVAAFDQGMAKDAKRRQQDELRTAGLGKRLRALVPGQYVAVDDTPIDFGAIDPATGRWVRLVLIVMIDLCTRSILAWRFVPKARSVDLALLIRDAIQPKPMLPDWPDRCKWPLPVPPKGLLVGLCGDQEPAGVPFVKLNKLVNDHSKAYVSRHARAVLRKLGVSILPSRVYTPTDKAQVEALCRAIALMFSQWVPGYCGGDVRSRGQDLESKTVYQTTQLDALFALWVVGHWQTRWHKGLSLDASPYMRLSPNRALHEAILRNGFIHSVPDPQLVVELLPTLYYHPQHNGIEIGPRTYNSAELAPARDRQCLYPGTPLETPKRKRMAGGWPFKVDPRDITRIWFLRPAGNSPEEFAAPDRWVEVPWIYAGAARVPFGERTYAFCRRELQAHGIKLPDQKQVSEQAVRLFAQVASGDAVPKATQTELAAWLVDVAAWCRDYDRPFPPPLFNVAGEGSPERPAPTVEPPEAEPEPPVYRRKTVA